MAEAQYLDGLALGLPGIYLSSRIEEPPVHLNSCDFAKGSNDAATPAVTTSSQIEAEPASYFGDSNLFCRAGTTVRLRVSFPRFKGIFVKPKIELTSVIQALAVAEHLSFRRAADALGVCQSSVSKRVIKLENLLGVALFDRHHAGVKVTNAGIHFFEHVKLALEYLDLAIESAGMAGRVERGNLKVGIISSLASGFLPELLRRYSALHPDIDVSFVEGAPRENLVLLRAEQLDIAFVMGEPVARDCDVVRFWSERMFVVLPETHRLCAKNAVAWEDLRGEMFVLSQSEPGLVLHDYVIRQLADPDHRPNVRQSPVARDTLMHMVALGQGISLTSEATIATPFPDIVFRPIAGNSDVLLFSGVWLLRNSNQALRRFISLARMLSKNRSETNARASSETKSRR